MNKNRLGLIKITGDLIDTNNRLIECFYKLKLFTLSTWNDELSANILVFKCQSENFDIVKEGEKIPYYMVNFSVENNKYTYELVNA